MKKLFTAIATATLLTATGAQADELVSNAGGWEVYRGADMAGGCYMTSIFEDGTLIQLGFDLAEDAAFLSAFNAEWTEAKDGETYPVTIALDDVTYTADAHGMRTEDMGGVLVMIDEEDFITDIAQRSTLSLSDATQEVARIDLEGTRAAVLATIDCLPS